MMQSAGGAREDVAVVSTGFDYELPQERIAQRPAPRREDARLLVVSRAGPARCLDSTIRDLPRWIGPGDVLVVNRSRVMPARLRGRRATGGRVELLLLSEADDGGGGPRWWAMARPARRLRVGERIELDDGGVLSGDCVQISRAAIEGAVEIAFPEDTDVLALVDRLGEVPLPPYIVRPEGPDAADRDRYQTVFAREPGSIAAPTAGLHLTEELLARIRQSGVEIAEIVLHVGPATFLAGQPGRSQLAVEPERFQVPGDAGEAIRRARGRGRVVAVGTTTTRALEAAARAGWPIGWQTTDLVLKPGSSFRVVDALLTNFHLPGSSLLALVSAFAGVEQTRAAYEWALASGYRFYSYGDAMLIV